MNPDPRQLPEYIQRELDEAAEASRRAALLAGFRVSMKIAAIAAWAVFVIWVLHRV